MFNFDKLLGRIIEKYGTRKAFAAAMEMSESSLCDRLNGKIPFKTEEIWKAAKLLDIRPEEIGEYFFTPKVR